MTKRFKLNLLKELEKSGNLGLAKQCLEAFRRKKLLQLTRTYVTISLHDIGTAAGMKNDVEAEKTLLYLVDESKVSVGIDLKPTKMVTFLEDDESYDNVDMMNKVNEELSKIMDISLQLRSMDTEIVQTAKFASKIKDKERRKQQGNLSGSASGAASSESAGSGWNESMMEP
jgi:COP9 signalosome complex subunit 3